MGGLFVVVGGGGSFTVHRREWGDGICVGCCRGWEGFSAHGGWGGVGFPTPGVLWRDDALGDKAAKGHSKWQWGYQSHREGGRKMNYWVRRESTGSSGSPVKPPVQTVQFRFDCFPVQLARPNRNHDQPMVELIELASPVWFLKPWYYMLLFFATLCVSQDCFLSVCE